MLPKSERDVAPPALIQQGLVDLDPDVDAIFRLTQGQELTQIKYCKESLSIRLAPGTFLSLRVCDIWRGYWVQRLLWDVNGSLTFTKPTVEQIHNAYNYLDDFEDEIQLYTDISRFIAFLADWTSTSLDLETRIVELMKAMAAEKFIGEADVDLAQRWVKDLTSPRSWQALKSCHSNSDPSTSKVHLIENPFSNAFKDVLLVVNFSSGQLYNTVIDYYLEIYKLYFPNIVFYGDPTYTVPERFRDMVKPLETNYSSFGYLTLDAMEQHPGYRGYLHTNDDVVLNPRQLATYDKNKTWKDVPRVPEDLHDLSQPGPDPWTMWSMETSGMWSDTTLFTPEQRGRIAKSQEIQDRVMVYSLDQKMHEHKIHLELVMGVALLVLEPTTEWVRWKEYLWDFWGTIERTRKHWMEWPKPGVGMPHAVTMSAGEEVKEYIKNWVDTVAIVQITSQHRCAFDFDASLMPPGWMARFGKPWNRRLCPMSVY
ncbi:hypothetical protein MVEG_01729 [Podila verticillata NRRL 6337]|nr:hypothetical protein MVEG_01729 [Podila verticillata NRRL 6337]